MQKFKKYILASDVVSLYLALVLALIVRGALHPNAIQDDSVWLAAHLIIFLPSVFFSILALYIAGLYDAKIIYDRTKTIVLLFYTQFASAVFSIVSFYALRTELTPKLTLFFFIIISVLVLSISRGLIYKSFSRLKKPNCLFLTERSGLLNKINLSWGPYNIEIVNNLEDCLKMIVKKSAIIYDEKLLNTDLNIFLEKLKKSNISVYSYNQYFEFLHKKVDLENIHLGDLQRLLGENKETRGHFLMRRILDLICAFAVLPFFLISIPIVFILQKIEEGFKEKKSLFSVQERVGHLGKTVWLYKFRTMLFTDKGKFIQGSGGANSANSAGNKVTKVGWLLRKSRIDELPQVINLFKNEISFIGPRADILGTFEELIEKIPNFKMRLLVPQGLTGWAQVHQMFQPRTVEDTTEKFAYDLYYVKYRSVFLDFSILLKTIKTLLSRTGV